MNVSDSIQSRFKSSLHLHVPTVDRLHKLPKHPIGSLPIQKRSNEVAINPATPSRYRVSYSPVSSPSDVMGKHVRSSTVSPRGFKFIAATAMSPFEEFQTPATDFPNSEISEDLGSSLSLEEEPRRSPVYTSPRRSQFSSFAITDPVTSPQEEKWKHPEQKFVPLELHEKASLATRLTTHSVEEPRAFETEYSVLGRKIYCDRCEKNVTTEFLFRNAEKSLWEKLLCGVCYRGLANGFKEIVHYCTECGNEVALIRFKQEETYH